MNILLKDVVGICDHPSPSLRLSDRRVSASSGHHCTPEAVIISQRFLRFVMCFYRYWIISYPSFYRSSSWWSSSCMRTCQQWMQNQSRLCCVCIVTNYIVRQNTYCIQTCRSHHPQSCSAGPGTVDRPPTPTPYPWNALRLSSLINRSEDDGRDRRNI